MMVVVAVVIWLRGVEKSQNYVWRYLKNMERYGLALKNGDFWFLTDSGVEFVKYLDVVYNNIIINI
jgi:hypothetical protein